MKNKIIAAVFVSFLFSSSAVFARTAAHKEVTKESVGDLNARTVLLEKQVQTLQNKVDKMKKTEKNGFGNNMDLDVLVEMYAHGPAVVTSPSLGVRRSAEDASDLTVTLSSVNEDLTLLQIRKKMDDYAIKNNIPIPGRPIIALSGGLEGQTNYVHNYDKAKNTDVNLSRVELDVIGEAGPWATTAMIISYDDKAPIDNRKVKNSRLTLSRGFLTVGQLDKFPMYLTIGQIYAPFGSYSSDMITDSSTKLLGRYKDRMAVLGFYYEGLQAQIFGYSGETKGSKDILEHAGFNLGYEYAKDKFKINIAGSMIGNMAETDGMQDKIFAKTYGQNERISNRVYGVDGRIKVGYQPFTVRAEYIGAAKRFDSSDITFNDVGAKPQALQVEGSVEFKVLDKPNSFAIGYGHTWEALALGLPKDAYFAEYDIAIFKNTILGFEYRHDVNYGWTDKAGARGFSDPITVKGRHQNIVTIQLGIYF